MHVETLVSYFGLFNFSGFFIVKNAILQNMFYENNQPFAKTRNP